jgi:hypothetical protein
MTNTIKITNEDIGILFHPEAVKMRKKALAFLLLRIISDRKEGLLKKEIMRELRNQYNWETPDTYRSNNKEYDPIERSLFYLQYSSSDRDRTEDSKDSSPFVSIKLRQRDKQHVYRATKRGSEWVDTAKSEHDCLMQSVRQNADASIETIFGQTYPLVEQVSGLRKDLEDLIVNKLTQIALDEAKKLLTILNFEKKDIMAFEKYYEEILKNVSEDAITKSIGQLSKKLSEKERPVFCEKIENLIDRITRQRTDYQVWQEFIYAYTYNSLLFTLLPYIPDTSLNEYLCGQIKNTKLCLDTNVLLAILLDFDRNHTVAIEILQTLRELNVQVFWHDLAEREIRKKFAATRDCVEAIKSLTPVRRRNVLNEVWGEGYINTFFRGEYKSTLDMERTVLDRLRLTKDSDFYARSNGVYFLGFEKTLKNVADKMQKKWAGVEQRIDRETRKKFARPTNAGIHLEHDREILKWVYGLRHLSRETIETEKAERYLARHWVVSLDKKLIEAANAVNDSSDFNFNQPLAVSLRTLRLIVDPMDIMQAIKSSSLPESGIWMDKSFTDYLSEQIEEQKQTVGKDIVAHHIRQMNENLNDDLGE